MFWAIGYVVYRLVRRQERLRTPGVEALIDAERARRRAGREEIARLKPADRARKQADRDAAWRQEIAAKDPWYRAR